VDSWPDYSLGLGIGLASSRASGAESRIVCDTYSFIISGVDGSYCRDFGDRTDAEYQSNRSDICFCSSFGIFGKPYFS
jgi:hypothetical protein